MMAAVSHEHASSILNDLSTIVHSPTPKSKDTDLNTTAATAQDYLPKALDDPLSADMPSTIHQATVAATNQPAIPLSDAPTLNFVIPPSVDNNQQGSDKTFDPVVPVIHTSTQEPVLAPPVDNDPISSANSEPTTTDLALHSNNSDLDASAKPEPYTNKDHFSVNETPDPVSSNFKWVNEFKQSRLDSERVVADDAAPQVLTSVNPAVVGSPMYGDTSKYRSLMLDLLDRFDKVLDDAQLLEELDMSLATCPAAQDLMSLQDYRVLRIGQVPSLARPDDLGMFFEKKLPSNSIIEVSMHMRPVRESEDSGQRRGGLAKSAGKGGVIRNLGQDGQLSVIPAGRFAQNMGKPAPVLVEAPPQLTHGGWAQITVANIEVSKLLMAFTKEDLRFNGSTLRIFEGYMKSTPYISYRHPINTLTIDVMGMRLGLPPVNGVATPESLKQSSYTNSEGVHLTVDGTKTMRQVAISFSNGHYRTEFSLRGIYRPILFTEQSPDDQRLHYGKSVLRFHLRNAPFCYVDRELPTPDPTPNPVKPSDAEPGAENGLPAADQRTEEELKLELSKALRQIQAAKKAGNDVALIKQQAGELAMLLKHKIRERELGRDKKPAAPESPVERKSEVADIKAPWQRPHSEWFVWSQSGKVRQFDPNDEYERCPDPAGAKDNSFGRCNVIDLYLSEGVDQVRLLEVLERLSRRVKVVRVTALPPISEGLLPSSDVNDWADGFGHVFKDLSFTITYLLHGLVANRNIWFTSLEEAQLVCNTIKKNPDTAMRALEYQLSLPPQTHDPVSKLVSYLRNSYTNDVVQETLSRPLLSGEIDKTATRSVIITPLRVLPQPPEADSGNRVLRTYVDHADRFMRVSLADETMGNLKHASNSIRVIEGRVRPWIHAPMIIGGRRFIFLAYGNSQLREGSCWFYDEDPRSDDDPSKPYPTADQIRNSVGDLSRIRIPGKFAARLGQAFSSTMPTVEVPEEMTGEDADIERNGYCFSDGVGRISARLAVLMANELYLSRVPSAFQVRIGGCKGMVTVDPRIRKRDKQLCVRPSMIKFPGWNHRVLEVCSVAFSYPCYLNRQAISILTSLGVEEKVIWSYMECMMKDLSLVMEDEEVARDLLHRFGMFQPGVPMLEAGFKLNQDRHLRGIVKALRDRMLVDIKYRARVYVDQGLYLVGVLDEWNVLAEDEIYFSSSIREQVLPGTTVLIGRSPCLHPGDLRVVTMAREEHPELEHLKDVVVFSQRGERPLPNMLAGGDLDGDNFMIIWDEQLIPKKQVPAADYTPPELPIEHPNGVTVEMIGDFFVDFLVNEKVGLIANAHLAWADYFGSVEVPECLELAQLHSMAVDFAKTGIPPKFSRSLAPFVYPDFLQAETRPMYTSSSVLGGIYRWACKVIEDIESEKALEIDTLIQSSPDGNGYNPRIPEYVPEHTKYMEEALQLLFEYSTELLKLSVQYEIYNECELVTGFVRRDNRKNSRRRDRGRSGTEGPRAVSVIMTRFRELFWAEFETELQANGDELHGETRDERREVMWRDPDVLAKGAAWYKAAYHEACSLVQPLDVDVTTDGEAAMAAKIRFRSFLSFGWLNPGPVCFIKRILEHELAVNDQGV